MGWLKKAFSIDTYQPEKYKRIFEPETGFLGDIRDKMGVAQNSVAEGKAAGGPVSALMTAEENTAEAMKRLFRMGVYVAPMFGGEQSALASTKLFGN